MDHSGHASFVDYDRQVFIPILNITFPFWSAFYCYSAEITYLQNQALKTQHSLTFGQKMMFRLPTIYTGPFVNNVIGERQGNSL